MLQTKIFTSTDSNKLEKSLNRWLEGKRICATDIKHVRYLATQVGTTTKYNVLLMYDDEKGVI